MTETTETQNKTARELMSPDTAAMIVLTTLKNRAAQSQEAGGSEIALTVFEMAAAVLAFDRAQPEGGYLDKPGVVRAIVS